MHRISLSVIIVNYNGGTMLLNCINSIIKEFNGLKYEIVVVDNASKDESISLIEKLDCQIIKLEKNVGFVRANNIGCDNASGEYLYFLNPDTLVLDNNLSLLLTRLKENPKIGIIAPKVLNSDRTVQFSIRKEPTLRRLTFYLFGINRLFPKVYYFVDYKMELDNHNEICYPDWVSGAGFIIKKSVFEEVGMFDENIFMYWEDVDLCKRVKTNGYEIIFDPSSSIIHYGGGSSDKVKEFSMIKDIESRFYYFKKYYNGVYLFSIKLMTLTNVMLKSLFYLLKLDLTQSLAYIRIFAKLLIGDKRKIITDF